MKPIPLSYDLNFHKNTGNQCSRSKVCPSDNAILSTLLNSKKMNHKRLVVIARTAFLIRNRIPFDTEMDQCNLCIIIKEGIIHRSYFSNTLTHVIKKTTYHIEVLN